MDCRVRARRDRAVKNALCTRSHISPGTWDLWELQWDVPRSCETLVSLVLGSHLSRHVSHSSYLTYHYKASIRYTDMHSIASTESGFWTTSNIAHMSAAAPSSPQLPLLSRHERCDCGLSHLTLYTQTQHSSQPATADLATPCRHSYGIFVPPAHDHNAKCYFVDNVDMLLEKCVT